MRTKGLGNLWALFLIGSFIAALFVVDALTNNGNFSFFDFPGTESLAIKSPKNPPTNTQTPKHNYQPKHLNTQNQTFKGKSYDIAIVNLELAEIAFFWKNNLGKKIQTIRSLDLQLQQERKKLLFATNGGMFTAERNPVGLYVEDGKVLQKNNLKKDEKGNFFLLPNGIFYITNDSTAHIRPSTAFNDSLQQTVKYATQSGPMLLIDGEVHPKFGKQSENLNIRSGVGIVDSTTVVFAISNEEVNFYDFATLFQQNFGCRNALYLDGVISEMYLPELGRHDSTGRFGVMIGVFEELGEL